MKIKRIAGSLLAVVLAAVSVNAVFAEENEALTYDESAEIEDIEGAAAGNDIVNLSASSYTCGDYLYTLKSDGTAEIVGYTGEGGDIVIPSELNGYEVTSIAKQTGTGNIGAFYGSNITSVVVPDSVTSLEYAFQCCTSLHTAVLSDNIENMEHAFWGCTSLVNVNIPQNVKKLSYAFACCTSLSGTFEVPSSAEYMAYAFNGCTALEGIITNGIQTIGNRAFLGCTSLTSVVINYGTEEIDSYAFSGCTNLESITAPDTLTKVDSNAFNSCTAIKYFEVAEGSQTTPLNLLSEIRDNLESVVIPDCVTSIGYSSFYNCTKLTSVTLGSGLQQIEDSAFCYCTALPSISLPDSLEVIDRAAFSGCTSLTSVTIPDNVYSIGGYAFSGCTKLAEVILPTGIYGTAIDDCAFSGCTKLLSVIVPENITYIGDYALGSYSYSYTDGKGTASISGFIIYGYNNTAAELYANEFEVNFVSLGDAAAGLGDYCYSILDDGTAELMRYLGNETEITVPETINGLNVTSIGSEVFYMQTDIVSAVIPNSIENIGDYSFYECTGLTQIEIPSSVLSIGEYAFAYCTGLQDLKIYYGLSTIGKSAFRGCTGITAVDLPESITSIDQYAFSGAGLTSVTIPAGISVTNQFNYCTDLENVKIQSGTVSIGYAAFSDCTSLKNIIIPSSVSSFSTVFGNLFTNCSALNVYCVQGSTADNADLYPEDSVLIYMTDEELEAMTFETVSDDDSDDTAAGDLNGDGKVSTKDAVLALQMAVGQISTDTAADVNGDGKVSTKDAVLILQYAVGQIDSF